MIRIFHKDGTIPANGEVFVFGSNLAGRHGLGAALIAQQKFGASYGVGRGRMGQSYGIPTKTERLAVRQINEIQRDIEDFIAYAKHNSDERFFITRIGCGLAGFADSEIAPFFKNASVNCSLPDTWAPYLASDD